LLEAKRVSKVIMLNYRNKNIRVKIKSASNNTSSKTTNNEDDDDHYFI
jgi:hypothetical protein